MRRSGSIIAVALLVGLSCQDPLERVPRPSGRVLLIALDGATWDLMDPLIAQGRLPNLAKLSRQGSRGVLTSIIGVSPTLFTTIATGKTPEQHGIRAFVKKGDVPYTNADRRVRALWNVVSERGGTVNVVGWFTTWPADEVNGAFISDRAEGALAGGAFPRELDVLLESTGRSLPKEEAERKVQRLYGPPLPASEESAEMLRLYADFERSILDYFRTDLLRLEWAETLFRQQPADFNAVFFKGIDPICHQGWIYAEPDAFQPRFRPTPAARARYGDSINRYYAFMDEAIGRLVEAVPAGTHVMIVSDHGFGPNKEEPGYLAYRLNPLLARAGFLATDATHRPMEARSLLFDPTASWNEERTERKLRLNPALRESLNLEEILGRLRALSTPAGVPIFSKVTPAGPDEIEVVLEPRLEQLEDQADGAGIVSRRLGHSGGHRFEGIVLLAGPAVHVGAQIEEADLYDVVPTLLRLLRLPPARDMQGKVLESALRLDALGPALPMVSSYETDAPIRRVETSPMPEELDEEFRERLRTLGYIQ